MTTYYSKLMEINQRLQHIAEPMDANQHGLGYSDSDLYSGYDFAGTDFA